MKQSLALISLFIITLLIAGCGSEKGSSGAPAVDADEPDSADVRFETFNVIRDRSVEFMQERAYTDAVALSGDVTAIASRDGRFWAGDENGKVVEVELQIVGEYENRETAIINEGTVTGAVACIHPQEDTILVGSLADGYNGLTLHLLESETLNVMQSAAVELGSAKPGFTNFAVTNDAVYLLTARPDLLLRLNPSDPLNPEPVETAPGAGPIRGKDLAFDGSILWILSAGAVLQGLDPVSGSIVKTIDLSPLGVDAGAYALRSLGGRLYCWKGETLWSIDPSGEKILGSYTTDRVVDDLEMAGDDLVLGHDFAFDFLDPETLALRRKSAIYGGENFIVIAP